jgi:hypothetical protein
MPHENSKLINEFLHLARFTRSFALATSSHAEIQTYKGKKKVLNNFYFKSVVGSIECEPSQVGPYLFSLF